MNANQRKIPKRKIDKVNPSNELFLRLDYLKEKVISSVRYSSTIFKCQINIYTM